MTKAYADILEGQVSYRMEGTGEPLLLLHQRPMSLEEYSQMIPILARSYRVVVMDIPGYGYSDDPSREYEIEDYAQSVVNFLSAIGISKTSIAAHHTGASIAVEVAAANPGLVDKLIVSGLPFWEPEKWKQYAAELGSRIRPPADDGLFLIDRWQIFRSFSPHSKPELLLKPMALMLNALTRPYEARNALARYNIKPRLPLVKSPTLLISGSEDMFLDQLEATKSLIPRCKTQIIEGAGELICFEKPDEFAQAILDFMKNLGV